MNSDVCCETDAWPEKKLCRLDEAEEVEEIVNPSDDDAARANIIATSIDAGAGILVAILLLLQ